MFISPLDYEFNKIKAVIDKKELLVPFFHIRFTHPDGRERDAKFAIVHFDIHTDHYMCRNCTCEKKEYFVVACDHMFNSGDAPCEIGQSLDTEELKDIWLKSYMITFKEVISFICRD
jgi:hypothetical protein